MVTIILCNEHLYYLNVYAENAENKTDTLTHRPTTLLCIIVTIDSIYCTLIYKISARKKSVCFM